MKALSERTKPRLITSVNASPNKGKRVLRFIWQMEECDMKFDAVKSQIVS
jgi:hypothetical protein